MNRLKQILIRSLSIFLSIFLISVFFNLASAAAVGLTAGPENPLPPKEPLSKEQLKNLGEAIKNSDWQGPAVVKTGANCFDYYRFQSVQVSLGTDREVYRPEEKVRFQGELLNENDYPIIDGYVFVRISRKNDNYLTEGNYIIDEFFAVEKTSLDPKGKKSVQFDWNVPRSIAKGKYRADFFFSVGKKFNLGGLPFSNEIVVGSADFNIDSPFSGSLYFDRSTTKINGKAYRQIGQWPLFRSGEKVNIVQPLKNTLNKTEKAKVVYELYYWDSLDRKDKIDSRSEKVEIPPNSSSELSYTIPSVKESVYYLKITASADSQKSIINIRILGDQPKPRLNYPHLTKFPVLKGDKFTFATCFHNTSYASGQGRVVLTLEDKLGRSLGQAEYKGEIVPVMMALKKDIQAQKTYDYLKLKARVFDAKNNLADEYEVAYDCRQADLEECRDLLKQKKAVSGLVKKILKTGLAIVLFLVLILLGFLFLRRRKINKDLTLLLILGTGLMFSQMFSVRPVDASYYQKSSTVSQSYGHAWWLSVDQGCSAIYNKYGASNRQIATGNLSIVHRVGMTSGDYTVYPGAAVNFVYQPDNPFFTAYGGPWDTPYGAWCSGINTYCKNIKNGQYITSSVNGLPGYILWTAVKPSVYMTSSNSAIIKCSGMNCTAVSPGTAVLTANIPATQARIWSYIGLSNTALQKKIGGTIIGNLLWWWPSESATYLHPGDTNVHCEDPGTPAIWDYVGRNSMYLPAASLSWTIKVIPSPTLSVSLSANPSSGDAPLDDVDLTADVGGTASGNIRYRFDCTSDGVWDKDYTTSADPYTAYNLCEYSSPGVYTAKVKVDRQGLTAYDTVDINVASPPTLSVSLSANPSSGDAPLSTELKADISGTAQGNINYTFWKDCDSGCNTVADCQTACGSWDAKYDNQSSLSQSYFTAYGSAGTYTAKVVAERESLSAEDRTNVVVNTPPPAPTADIKANGSDGPITVEFNSSVDVNWTSENATSCSVSPTGWSGTSGSQSSGELTASVTYLLDCIGPGGGAEDSVTVNVNSLIPRWREVTPF
jgi:hypothetical protein